MKQTVEAYSLPDFVQAIQVRVRDGWVIDFDDNESTPVSWTGYYRCRMKKGGQVAALLLPSVQENDVEPIAPALSVTDKNDDYVEPQQPFVPSVVFTVEQTAPAPKAKAGRPKASQI